MWFSFFVFFLKQAFTVHSIHCVKFLDVKDVTCVSGFGAIWAACSDAQLQAPAVEIQQITRMGVLFATQCAFSVNWGLETDWAFGNHSPYLQKMRSLSSCSSDFSSTFELRITSLTPPGSMWGCITRLWFSWIQREALLWWCHVILRFLQKPSPVAALVLTRVFSDYSVLWLTCVV